MTSLKKFLVVTAAVGAIVGLASPAFAVNSATTVHYVASSTPPATLSVATAQFTIDGSQAALAPAFGVGNTITFALSQGTFNTAPVVTGGAGTTLSFVSGGTGSSSVTYQFTAIGAPTVQISGVTVAGLTGVADSGAATPTRLTVLTTSNVAGYNTASSSVTAAAGRGGVLADFVNPFTVATAPTNQNANLAATPAGTVFVNASPVSMGTVTLTSVAGLVDYSNAALVPGKPAASITIPFNAGSLSQARINPTGSCSSTVTFTTGTSPAIGGTLTQASTAGVAPALGGTCTYDLDLTATGAAGTLIAAGPTAITITETLTGGPAGVVSSYASTFGTIGYSGGQVTNLTYAVGQDSGYQYYVWLGNNGAAAVTPGWNIGKFSATTPSIAAGTGSLVSVIDIRNALIAAGAPSTTFIDSSARASLNAIGPTTMSITPLLRNSATGIVTEIGTDFGDQCHNGANAGVC